MQPKLRTFAFVLALLIGSAPNIRWHDGIHAQSPDHPCSDCRLNLARIAILPSDGGDVQIPGVPHIGLVNGSFVLTPTYDGNVAVWEGGVMDAIGRAGNGPDEFPQGQPADLVVNAGRTYVAHGNRLSLLSIEDRRIRRQVVLPWRPLALAAIADHTIAAGPDGQLVRMDTAGKVVDTFALPRPLASLDIPRLAVSGDTALWVGSVFSYDVHLIGLDGSVRTSWSRAPRWFRDVDPRKQGTPSPRIYGVREVGGGLLMVLGLVTDPNWRREYARSVPMSQAHTRPLYDTVVELVDPRDGRLISTARYDEFLRFVAGSNYLFTTRESDEGELLFDVFEVQIRR